MSPARGRRPCHRRVRDVVGFVFHVAFGLGTRPLAWSATPSAAESLVVGRVAELSLALPVSSWPTPLILSPVPLDRAPPCVAVDSSRSCVGGCSSCPVRCTRFAEEIWRNARGMPVPTPRRTSGDRGRSPSSCPAASGTEPIERQGALEVAAAIRRCRKVSAGRSRASRGGRRWFRAAQLGRHRATTTGMVAVARRSSASGAVASRHPSCPEQVRQ